MLELLRENVFDLRDEDRVIGRVLDHKFEGMFRLFWFGLSAISKSILGEDLTIGNLFIVLADGIDMSFDGLHEQRAERLTIGLPSNRTAFLDSGNASDPRLLVLTLQFPDLIDQLLQALHHHFYLRLLKHAIS